MASDSGRYPTLYGPRSLEDSTTGYVGVAFQNPLGGDVARPIIARDLNDHRRLRPAVHPCISPRS